MIFYTIESLEYRLAHPLSKPVITLYHASPLKLDEIKPKSHNKGTRLSSPRYSSFWSDSKKACMSVVVFMEWYNNPKFDEDEHPNIYDYENNICYIDQYTANIMKKYTYYLYEADIPTKYVSLGHHPRMREYTIDYPVLPKKVHKFNAVNNPGVKIKDSEWIKQKINHNLGYSSIGDRKDRNFIEDLIYLSNHDGVSRYESIIKDVNKFNNIDFK